MKHRKLRGYVLPTLYVVVLIIIFGTVSIVSSIFKKEPNYVYSTQILEDVEVEPVVSIDGALSTGIVRPYLSEEVTIDKYFYDTDGTQETQEKALIYFQNTYMKNTGVLYTAPNSFDCVMVLDGSVLNIKEDEILGKVVEIEHNTNLRTIYYSMGEVNVNVGDVLSQGEIIGTSGTSNISENSNNLLFEVYYNGTLINPEEFYTMDAATLN